MSSTPDRRLVVSEPESQTLQRLREELEQERNSRREAQTVLDAVLEATSQDLYQKNQQLSRLNAELEARVRERTSELAHATAAAERADAAKSEFLARMSHEIRTPMNGVLGMLDVLRSSVRDAEQAHYADTAYGCAASLLTIIDDILDFSKIEAGKLELETLDFDLHALLRRLVLLWGHEAERKHLALELVIAADVPRALAGDPTRLMQVLGNLVSNGLKFTAQGFVCVRLEREPAPGPDVLVRFTVEDSGIGIPREAQRTLFSAFSQAESSTSRRFGGSGLGLAICRQLLTMMGGEIELTSAPGRGSRFSFTLPFAVASHPVAPAGAADESAAQPSGRFELPVLVVDDNEVNREVAGVILAAWGCRVLYAADGREALERLRTSAPALVLMDCHMPHLDGFECTRAIRTREQEARAARLPVIGVSASTAREERERCMRSGMDDFLPKPINRAAIGALLQRWLRPTAPAVPGAPAVPAAAPAAAGALLDLAHLEEMRAAAGEDFARLVARFEETSREQLEGMRAALARHDAQALRRLAHKLKGAASALGASALAGHCARIERRAKAGAAIEAAELGQLAALREPSCAQLARIAATAVDARGG